MQSLAEKIVSDANLWLAKVSVHLTRRDEDTGERGTMRERRKQIVPAASKKALIKDEQQSSEQLRYTTKEYANLLIYS